LVLISANLHCYGSFGAKVEELLMQILIKGKEELERVEVII